MSSVNHCNDTTGHSTQPPSSADDQSDDPTVLDKSTRNGAKAVLLGDQPVCYTDENLELRVEIEDTANTKPWPLTDEQLHVLEQHADRHRSWEQELTCMLIQAQTKWNIACGRDTSWYARVAREQSAILRHRKPQITYRSMINSEGVFPIDIADPNPGCTFSDLTFRSHSTRAPGDDIDSRGIAMSLSRLATAELFVPIAIEITQEVLQRNVSWGHCLMQQDIMEIMLSNVARYWDEMQPPKDDQTEIGSLRDAIAQIRDDVLDGKITSGWPRYPVNLDERGLMIMRKPHRHDTDSDNIITELTIGVDPAFGVESALIRPLPSTGEGINFARESAAEFIRSYESHHRKHLTSLPQYIELGIQRTRSRGLQSMLQAALTHPTGPGSPNLTFPYVRFSFEEDHESRTVRKGGIFELIVNPMVQLLNEAGTLTAVLLDETVCYKTAQEFKKTLSGTNFAVRSWEELTYCLHDMLDSALPRAMEGDVLPVAWDPSNPNTLVLEQPDAGGLISKLYLKMDHTMKRAVARSLPLDKSCAIRCGGWHPGVVWTARKSFKSQLMSPEPDLACALGDEGWMTVTEPLTVHPPNKNRDTINTDVGERHTDQVGQGEFHGPLAQFSTGEDDRNDVQQGEVYNSP